METSGYVAKKTEIVFKDEQPRAKTTKRRLLVTGITIFCFALVIVLIHSKSFTEYAMIEEISKRNWLSELFGTPPSDPVKTTAPKALVTTTQAPVTDDPFDSWFESLFEPDLDQNKTDQIDGEASVSSSTINAAKGTTASRTPTATKKSATSTSANNTLTSARTAAMSTSASGEPTQTPTSSTTIATTPEPYNSTTATSTTPDVTTLPFCAEPNFRLADICIIPDQLQQQKNFNITYQDFVDAVSSDYVVTFWEGCEHDDPCRPGVDVNNIVKGLAETWINGNKNAQLCPWMDCLQFINQTAEFCMKDKEHILRLTKLMCSFDFHINTEDRKCAEDVIRMLNRDMADELASNPNITMKRCHDNFSPCRSDCKKQYEDMANIFDVTCLKYTSSLTTFSPWHWFSKHQAIIKTACKLETRASVESSENHGFNYYDKLIEDKGLLAGIVLSCVVTLIAILILSAVFVKRVRRGKYYARDGVEYSEVTGLMAGADETEKHHF